MEAALSADLLCSYVGSLSTSPTELQQTATKESTVTRMFITKRIMQKKKKKK